MAIAIEASRPGGLQAVANRVMPGGIIQNVTPTGSGYIANVVQPPPPPPSSFGGNAPIAFVPPRSPIPRLPGAPLWRPLLFPRPVNAPSPPPGAVPSLGNPPSGQIPPILPFSGGGQCVGTTYRAVVERTYNTGFTGIRTLIASVEVEGPVSSLEGVVNGGKLQAKACNPIRCFYTSYPPSVRNWYKLLDERRYVEPISGPNNCGQPSALVPPIPFSSPFSPSNFVPPPPPSPNPRTNPNPAPSPNPARRRRRPNPIPTVPQLPNQSPARSPGIQRQPSFNPSNPCQPTTAPQGRQNPQPRPNRPIVPQPQPRPFPQPTPQPAPQPIPQPQPRQPPVVQPRNPSTAPIGTGGGGQSRPVTPVPVPPGQPNPNRPPSRSPIIPVPLPGTCDCPEPDDMDICNTPCIQELLTRTQEIQDLAQKNEEMLHSELTSEYEWTNCDSSSTETLTASGVGLNGIISKIEMLQEQLRLLQTEVICNQEPYLAFPEQYTLKLGSDIPRASIIMREQNNNGNWLKSAWTVTVPHPSTTNLDLFKIAEQIRGEWRGELTLIDNSKFIVHLATADVARAYCRNIAQTLVDSRFLPSNLEERIKVSNVKGIKKTTLFPFSVTYYPEGLRRTDLVTYKIFG